MTEGFMEDDYGILCTEYALVPTFCEDNKEGMAIALFQNGKPIAHVNYGLTNLRILIQHLEAEAYRLVMLDQEGH